MGGNNAGVWPKRKRVSPHKNGGVDATDRPPLSSNFAVIGSLGCLLGEGGQGGGRSKLRKTRVFFTSFLMRLHTRNAREESILAEH